MQVQVGVDQEVILWFLFHQEGSGKGGGNLCTFFHHITELTCGGAQTPSTPAQPSAVGI